MKFYNRQNPPILTEIIAAVLVLGAAAEMGRLIRKSHERTF